MPSKICVLIPTYNRANFLAECIDSLLAQTLPPYQIIVVDNGSDDNTRQAVEIYKTRIEYIYMAQLGRAAAINEGLALCRGEYLWVFDDDDVALPDALERFVEPLVNSGEYGFSYSKFYYAITRSDSNRIGRVIKESTIPDVEKKGFLPSLLESNFLCGAALFARVACYEKVGKFEPLLFRSQDYEMAIRIARQFRGTRVAGGPTFLYRQHEGFRGPILDRFEEKFKFNKWLEYDQKFFGKLLAELPLEEYLSPGLDFKENFRQALIERLAISITKVLITQACEDLMRLSRMDYVLHFTNAERDIIRTVVNYLLYSQNSYLKNYLLFAVSLRDLAKKSKTIKYFRSEIFVGFLADFLRTRSISRLKRSMRLVGGML